MMIRLDYKIMRRLVQSQGGGGGRGRQINHTILHDKLHDKLT